jgi:hypothetical protein
MRIIIAGIVGGIVMFMWGFVSHMMLGVGSHAFKYTPTDAQVVAAMKANMPESGIYFLPGMDMTKTPTEEEWAAIEKKAAAGPTAFVVYNTDGTGLMTPGQMGGEFASNLLGALVVAFILSWSAPGIGRRTMIAAFIGLAAWLSIDVSYWNWYRFPTAFIVDELIEQVIGWLLTGAAMAFVLSKSRLD